MGVTYKLRDEVVNYIISQRQGNPFFSCRQLAESASQKFGLRLSKSSVHDVLKESGIVTPRGRKPKNKFEIPRERKKQIQDSISQVKLLPSIVAPPQNDTVSDEGGHKNVLLESVDVCYPVYQEKTIPPRIQDLEISSKYDGAGRIFFKAALLDLGIFSEENTKEEDWHYFLTYSKGIKVLLEDSQEFFIDLPLPIERCIRETADGLISNIVPLVVHKVSDDTVFKSCMDAKNGFKIQKIEIVGQEDQILFEFSSVVDFKRRFIEEKRLFVESNEKNAEGRAKTLFFPQIIENNDLIEQIANLKGFDSKNNNEKNVSLLVEGSYSLKNEINAAAEKLNQMYLRDEEGRLVRVVIKEE